MHKIVIGSASILLASASLPFASELSLDDQVSFECQGTTYKLKKISGEDALSPKNSQQQEMVSFIRYVLDVPLEVGDLRGRKLSTDGFLRKAAETKDVMIVLYQDNTPFGFARITDLSILVEFDAAGQIVTMETRDYLTKHGLTIDSGYHIGGELIHSYQQQGYMTKLAPLCAEQMLKVFFAHKENPYFFLKVSRENIPMNKVCQNVLKCDFMSGQGGTSSGEQERQSYDYIYRLPEEIRNP